MPEPFDVPVLTATPERDLIKLEKDTLTEIQKILENHDYIESDIGIVDVNRYWALKNQYRLLLKRPRGVSS